jgi:hypothetical protein
MLESFVYARSTATGDRLLRQGEDAATPLMHGLFDAGDPEFADDMLLILTNTVYALMGRVAAGQLPITEIMPTIERVLRRLTTGIPVATRPNGA